MVLAVDTGTDQLLCQVDGHVADSDTSRPGIPT